VDIVDFAFDPGTITIEAGTTVTWVNQDAAPHTATGDGGEFDTGELANGESASVTFDTPGTFTYHCEIHPDMTATIVVTEAGGQTPPSEETPPDDVTQMPETGTGVLSGGLGGMMTVLATLSALAFAFGVAMVRRRAA
jgi:hypothetical protein